MSYITTSFLNLRNQPLISPSTVIYILPKGSIVNKIADSEMPGWWKVAATSIGNLEGFIASKYVEEIEDEQNDPVEFPLFPENSRVHLDPKKSSIKRSSVNGRAFPLNEDYMPYREGGDVNSKIASIYKIIDFLDVKNSKRYGPTVTNTFCNIYAYDFCYLCRVYLPRVWWVSKAINSILNGTNVPVIYSETVREMNANSLFDWLNEYGDDFGWRRVFSLDELQGAINATGSVGIVCAKNINTNHSGHITCVLPEDHLKGYRAKAEGGKILAPLQSQAGRTNLKIFSANWWSNPMKFKEFGFWIHD